MDTILSLIFFVALIAAIYFAVRFAIDRIAHRATKHRGRNALITLGVSLVALVAVGITAPSTDLTPAQARTQLHQAQTTTHTLAAQAASASQRQTKLTKQKTLLLAEVAKADAAKQKAASHQSVAESASSAKASSQAASVSHAKVVAASQSTARVKAASSSQAAAASRESANRAAASSQAASASRAQAQAARQQAQASSQAATHSAPTNNGDMNTAATGQIVGNVNSKIYHVPGQAGYRMNSANAVYFNSEAKAQAAGYRKSLR